jgi:hypothetical protein
MPFTVFGVISEYQCDATVIHALDLFSIKNS